jgi:hypothetical protein
VGSVGTVVSLHTKVLGVMEGESPSSKEEVMAEESKVERRPSLSLQNLLPGSFLQIPGGENEV